MVARLPAQTLPAHAPLRIVVVSDEVNPHGLPPEELTQPGEVSAALLASSPPLQLDPLAGNVVEIATDQIEEATALLQIPRSDPSAYDVLVYFAHRIPNGGVDPEARQEAFVAAVDQFLVDGGGVVSFHHGIYRTSGKESMQALLGGEATGAVPYDSQDVIDVAPGHFVTTNGVTYAGSVAYSDPGNGVAAGTYDLFTNTPDERYPSLDLFSGDGETRVLFASDYDDGGTAHVLGWIRRRAEWRGVVVVYQPGEYQPNALSPGNNLQILLNAVVYAGTRGLGEDFESGGLSAWTVR